MRTERLLCAKPGHFLRNTFNQVDATVTHPYQRCMEPTRSFYAASVREFLVAEPNALIGQMSVRLAALHRQAEHDQLRAWAREIELLRETFSTIGEAALDWSILFEAPMLRLGRRMDVVVLMPGVVAVVEFKVGSKSYNSQDIAQTEYYALCLRDFHAASQVRTIVPILCADLAASSHVDPLPVIDGVSTTLLVNRAGLGPALLAAAALPGPDTTTNTPHEFEISPYRPTPTIIEAARALYEGHTVADLGRGDASALALEASSERLIELVLAAKAQTKKVICFVTGTPGAGKTLLGLNIALKSRIAGSGLPPASLLSGNPPLVHVLVEALADDAHRNRKIAKPLARRQAGSAIQGLLGFLREHTDGASPPEQVIVFDEAQRAWDADVGLKLLGRKRSEPALFLDIMAKGEWACLICLVGPGQEINRGEGGLGLWADALVEAAEQGDPWEVWAAPQAILGGPDIGTSALATETDLAVNADPLLHLSNAMRAYRSPQQVRWVSRLLDGDTAGAAAIAEDMDEPPALITRDLQQAKTWLAQHRRGGRSVGLLSSSAAVRVIAEGLPSTPRSNELDAIGHWFLKPHHDYRASGALETPLSEFGCQGLELDYVGLCWGGDLIWDGNWKPRTMAAPHWRNVKSEDRRRFRINGYRVLLTRARLGTIIYVPRGSHDDPTREPSEFDAIAAELLASGCKALDGIVGSST